MHSYLFAVFWNASSQSQSAWTRSWWTVFHCSLWKETIWKVDKKPPATKEVTGLYSCGQNFQRSFWRKCREWKKNFGLWHCCQVEDRLAEWLLYVYLTLYFGCEDTILVLLYHSSIKTPDICFFCCEKEISCQKKILTNQQTGLAGLDMKLELQIFGHLNHQTDNHEDRKHSREGQNQPRQVAQHSSKRVQHIWNKISDNKPNNHKKYSLWK